MCFQCLPAQVEFRSDVSTTPAAPPFIRLSLAPPCNPVYKLAKKRRQLQMHSPLTQAETALLHGTSPGYQGHTFLLLSLGYCERQPRWPYPTPQPFPCVRHFSPLVNSGCSILFCTTSPPPFSISPDKHKSLLGGSCCHYLF